jgi:hypothetical protein
MRFRILIVMTLLLLLFPIAASAQFYQLKTYGASGEGLSTLVKADLNHDGKPDAVGLSFQGGQTYAVVGMLGDGKGGFLPPKSTLITNLDNANNLSVGDFNDDGFPDVVVAGSDPVTGAPSIGIMLGKGDGTFQPTKTYPSGTTYPVSFTVTGAFTGNGKIDVALVAPSGGVSVVPGKGNGVFGSPIMTTMSLSSTCLAAADFNKDGKLDLTNGTDVLLGNGDGTFQAPLAVPEGNCGVAIADLNHDGIPDLVTGSSPSDSQAIRVHLGNGTGKFDVGTPYHTGHTAGSVIHAADLTGSGATDIVVLNGGDADFTILLNQGSGTFKIGNTYNGGDNPFTFFIADLNQADKSQLDLAFLTIGSIAVAPGNGDGTFQDELAQNDLNPVQILVTAADVNNDGKADLIFANGVALGNGDGTFQPPIPFPTGCNNITTVGDFNHDGKLDIAGPGAGFQPSGVFVCLGNGDGTFGKAAVYDQSIQHQFVLAGDFNHDGNLDLAASDQGGISILLGKGDGTFRSGIPTAVNAVFPKFALGDFNNDGKLDIAATDTNTVSVLLGKGNGKFSAPVTNSIPGAPIYAGDMNNDGKLDLVVLTAGTENAANVWLGNGNGTFKQASSTKTAGTPHGAVLGDFNLDGNLDVAVDAGPFATQVLLGNGKGGLKPTKYLSGAGQSPIVTADFNGDHRPDLVVTPFPGNHLKLVVFLNTLK